MNQNQIEAIDSIAFAIDQALVLSVTTQANDLLKARLAEARAGVVQYDILNHVIEAEAKRTQDLPLAAQPKQLPKMQPLPVPRDTRKWEKQRPGIAKKLKGPRSFACPTCHAEVGTNCFKFTKRGTHGVVTGQRNSGTTFHLARQALSTAANDKVRREYDREHFTVTE